MTPDAIEEAAQVLSRARQDVVALISLPEHCRPRTIAEGYQIQRAFMRIWRQPLIGWKIGATAAAVQKLFKIDAPFYGPLYAGGLLRSPTSANARDFQHFAIESEFALRLCQDLAPRATAWPREELLAAVDAVVPAFEIVSPRFTVFPFDAAPSAIADCSLNGGLVIGTPYTDWRRLDLVNHKVRLSVDGVVRAEGSGANVLGSPLKVLEWSVNALSAAGIGLRKGQLISTGTTTGVVTLQPGETAVADFGTLGSIELKLN